MKFLVTLLSLAPALALVQAAPPALIQINAHTDTTSINAASNCFPAIGFTMPDAVPTSLDNWWCDYSTEYAFVGFSYGVSDCQSASQLKREFLDIKNKFHGRYVRLYSSCDRKGFYNDVVDAAWNAGIGVFSLIWFGFDGSDEWKARRDTLFSILHSNPKAKFVTRAVQFGSEPLYDGVLSPSAIEAQVSAAKKNLASLQIPVTVSDLAYSFKELDGGDVLADLDLIAAHILPFFSEQASTAAKSWPIVTEDLNYFISNGNNKKIFFTQNGWPSAKSSNVQPNSPDAVANVANERAYYKLLDDHCEDLKAVPGGGVGWFAHVYSDEQEPGYGLYNTGGSLKFPFAPRTSC